MKDNKGVYVTNKTLKIYHQKYDICGSRPYRYDSDSTDCEVYKDFSCQYDSKRDNVICTCKRVRNATHRSPRQIYRAQERYPGWKSFTDIGVGNGKSNKKRTRRIYVPETDDIGVGSSDLSLLKIRNTEYKVNSYYEHKKTSSKCIGGVIDFMTKIAVSEKLSPITHTKSGTTSPINIEGQSKEDKQSFESYTVNEISVATLAEVNNDTQKYQVDTVQGDVIVRKETETIKVNESIQMKKAKPHDGVTANEENFSSDSLVQHVHNLESPSYDKQSRTSIDVMENKIEREYMKMFSTKNDSCTTSNNEKTNLKSTSVLKRRFEALRKGFNKKQDSYKQALVDHLPSQKSIQSRKDVSIASDPPSLEARSFSNTKVYSPFVSFIHPYRNQKASVVSKISPEGKEYSPNWSTDVMENDQQGVTGMFKLWGRKFNLEEDNLKKVSPKSFDNDTRKQEKKVEIIEPEKPSEERKGMKFSFFKKRSKDKPKEVFKSKKGVTAGRCEVKDGLTINLKTNETKDVYSSPNTDKLGPISNGNYNDILRKAWFKQFLTNTVDSRKSVQVRWNNNMYAGSSSTVFELLDCVYKNTDVVIRSESKSDITTCESSNYFCNYKPRVKFMPKNVEAWMIPKTVLDHQLKTLDMLRKGRRNSCESIEVSYSGKKWYVNKLQDGNKMEIVLNSKNFINIGKGESSEYILIDISKGFFSDTNYEQSSDEEVYKITDYESPDSSIYLHQQKTNDFETGDHITDNIQTSDPKENKGTESVVETVNKRPPLNRDVVIQGSQVYIPKHCEVISVGIITQRDIRDIKKPILKIQDDIMDEDSSHALTSIRKCELAESYLQDYYRNCMPMGIDPFSWCASDSHLKCSSDNNSLNSFNNQGDGSKSCPNIYDDYQGSTIVSSCETSSCSHCIAFSEEKPDEESKKSNFFQKFIRSDFCNTPKQQTNQEKIKPPSEYTKRVLPKDSLEVFKRRKLYAQSNKSNWNNCDQFPQPPAVPSCEYTKPTLIDCPKPLKTCCKPPPPRKGMSNKHVLLPDCNTLRDMTEEQLAEKKIEGILTFKGAIDHDICKGNDAPKTAGKQTRVISNPTCQIPQPPCIESCLSSDSPPCSEKNAPSCNVPKPPDCPEGSPAPCQPPCPPIPPPCQKPCPTSPPPCQKPPTPSPPPCQKPISANSSPCQKPLTHSSPPCQKPPTPSPPPCEKPSPQSPLPCEKPSHQSSPPYKKSSIPSPPPCKKPSPQSPPPCKKPSPPSPPPCKKPSPPSPPSCKKPSPPSPPPCKKPSPPSPPPCKKPSSQSPPPCKKPSPQSPPPFKKPTQKSPLPCKKPFSPSPPPVKKLSPRSPPCRKHCCPKAPCQTRPPPRPLSPPHSQLSCPPSPPPTTNPRSSAYPSFKRPHSSPSCPKSCAFSPTPSDMTCPPAPPPCLKHHSPTKPTFKRPRSPSPQRRNYSNLSPKSSQISCAPSPPPKTNPCDSAHPSFKRPRSTPSCPKSCTLSPTPSDISCPPAPPPCLKHHSPTRPTFKRPRSPSPPRRNYSNLSPKSSQISCAPTRPNPHTPSRSPCRRPCCSSHTGPELPPLQPCPQCYSPPQASSKKTSAIKYPKRPSPVCHKPFDSVSVSDFDEKQNSTSVTQTPCKGSCSQEFPWPTKNQLSNPPSQDCIHPKISEKRSPIQKISETFKKICKKLSPPNLKKEKDCKPYCANKSKARPIKPIPPAPPPSISCPGLALSDNDNNNNPSKMTGLYLKKLPRPANSATAKCTNQCNTDHSRVIRLSSKEKITIKFRKQTPSTEEIREKYNIKVKDEDGVTLYERRDYHRPSRNNTAQCTDTQIIEDLYRDSYVHRVSTPNLINDVAITGDNSESQSKCSSANLIEINFSLKFKQGDKTAELNLNKQSESPKEHPKIDTHLERSKEVFVVQDQCQEQKEIIDKNDVNIKILIKNYKPHEKKANILEKHETISNETNMPIYISDQFSKKISSKFQTVSTGYDDLVNQTYSIKEMQDSEKHITTTSHLYDEAIKHEETLLNVSSISITENTATEKTLSSKKNDENGNIDNAGIDKMQDNENLVNSNDTISILDEINTEKSEFVFTDDEKIVDNVVDGQLGKIPHDYKEKKGMLKKLLEKASTMKKPENKTAMKQIRDMLRTILTSDSSGHEDLSDTGNELIKELTCNSLHPDLLRNSDSLHKIFNADIISEENLSDNNTPDEELVYPSEENNSESSDSEETDEKNRHCMCSALATRLNLNSPSFKPCCCRGGGKKDEEIICNIIKPNNSYVIDMKANYVDVETQNSKYKNSLIKQTILMTNVSAMVKIKSEEIKRETICKFDEVYRKDKDMRIRTLNEEHNICCLANILQSNETKKAVLKIYAEKKYTEDGAHIVAKLPKFIVNRESEIYKEIRANSNLNKGSDIKAIN